MIRDLFEQRTLTEELVASYYATNETKKQCEKQLKTWKPVIFAALTSLGKDQINVGNYKVVRQIKNTSKLDEDKLVNLLSERPELKVALKLAVDEEKLQELISSNHITLEEIKEKCYIPDTTEALVIKAMKSE